MNTVCDHLGPVEQLNELEFIEGKLCANCWHTDDILVNDPASGVVEATLNLAALERPRPRGPEAVLNGIAWDPSTGPPPRHRQTLDARPRAADPGVSGFDLTTARNAPYLPKGGSEASKPKG